MIANVFRARETPLNGYPPLGKAVIDFEDSAQYREDGNPGRQNRADNLDRRQARSLGGQVSEQVSVRFQKRPVVTLMLSIPVARFEAAMRS